MEEFEAKALSTAPHPLWLRFVDNTLVIHKAEHTKQLLQHINSKDPSIQFTVEEPGPDAYIAFLDTKVTPGPNNTINTTVYRKPTHTDQHLHWDSNHFITTKHSVYNTLAHRVKVVSSNPTALSKELDHIRRAIQSCLFPTWALNRVWHNCKHKHNNRDPNPTDTNIHNTNDTTDCNKQRNISMVVSYIQGLGEKFKRVCNKQGIQVHFKGTNTINSLLMAPKDKDSKVQKNGVIYKYKCPHINCPEEYICESGRTFGDRFKEHLKAPSSIHQHTSTTGHTVSPDCIFSMNIKETMFIRVNDLSLNRNLGKLQLPHVWDQILQDTPTLHLK